MFPTIKNLKNDKKRILIDNLKYLILELKVNQNLKINLLHKNLVFERNFHIQN